MPRHLWHRSFQNNDYLIMSPPATASSPNMLMDRTFFIPLVILSRILETQTNTSFHAMEPHVKNKATRSPPHTRCEFHSISFAFCCIYWGDTGEQGYTGVRCIILRHILCALCCVFITPCQVSVHHHYPPSDVNCKCSDALWDGTTTSWENVTPTHGWESLRLVGVGQGC